MNVFIDGEPFPGSGDASDLKSTYGDMLDAARDFAAGRQRLIVGVEVDGLAVVGTEIDALSERRADAACIRLTTQAPIELVRCALLDAAEILNQSNSTRRNAIGTIHAGGIGEALRLINEISQRWQEVRVAVDQSALILGVSVGSLLTPRPNAAGAGMVHASSPTTHRDADAAGTETLAACLAEVARCVRDSDWSGLADVLEYDLGDETAEWCERLIRASAALASGEPMTEHADGVAAHERAA